MAREHQGPSAHTGMVVQQVTVGIRLYEQRYTRCCKVNCRTCYGRQPDFCGAPGHGPYWYLCYRTDRGWQRVYIGKDLNTEKFILEDGSINHHELAGRRHARIRERDLKRKEAKKPELKRFM